jgi:hypothetical protein
VVEGQPLTRGHGRDPKPEKAEVGAVVDRLRELGRRKTAGAKNESQPDDDAFRRLDTLEQRITHLEALLEGLQDAVDRQAITQNERIAELTRRTEPEEMARALSEDARRRGL